jgi:hypothetical protein
MSKTVMIVEDNELNMTLFQPLLLSEISGSGIRTASRGAEGRWFCALLPVLPEGEDQQ